MYGTLCGLAAFAGPTTRLVYVVGNSLHGGLAQRRVLIAADLLIAALAEFAGFRNRADRNRKTPNSPLRRVRISSRERGLCKHWVTGLSEPLRFRPAARLQQFLGKELIADPNVAVLEFVKNAYDAGASEVLIRFELSADPPTLTIADNGTGMTLADFRSNWMRPGFSSKASIVEPRKVAAGADEAERREGARIPVGEKGIGRLAAGRLGERLDVYTRRTPNRPWLHVEFDCGSIRRYGYATRPGGGSIRLLARA